MSHHPLLVPEVVEEVQGVLHLLGEGVLPEEQAGQEEPEEPVEQVVLLTQKEYVVHLSKIDDQ